MIYTIKYEILYKGNVVGYRIVDENGIESDVSDYFLSFLVRDGFVNNARFAGKSRKKIVSLDDEFDKITCKLDNVRIPKSELTGGIEVCLCNNTCCRDKRRIKTYENKSTQRNRKKIHSKARFDRGVKDRVQNRTGVYSKHS